MVTEQLKITFVELQEVTSPELNYCKYKEEICNIYLSPCIPKLSETLDNWQHVYCFPKK